jgi:tetratricopeptide (TPR) repeat protein
VVSKDELIEKIWDDAAVTDNTLEQCLADIRRAIGDDSRNPRFIKTFPRAGYRFISNVRETVSDPAADKSTVVQDRVVEEILPDAVSLGPETSRLIIRRRVVAVAGVLLVVVAGLSFYLIRRQTSSSPVSLTLNQSGKRPVAVMFFDNESDSTELDWLREGLADMIITDLSRSNNIAVLSRQQLRVLLDRLGHKESEKIRLEDAVEIARQSQAQLLVLGSFARLGEQIRIDVHIHDARDGQLLTAERLVVDQPAQILTQVDLLSLKLASYLAGSPGGQESNIGLSTVMTNNLEAYRYYSLGVEKAQALQNPEAIELLKRAIELDPQFAMAYARIGYAYAITWDRIDEGTPYLEKAFQLSDRLTEKDKLYIAGWYAIANFDFAAAIKSFQEIVSRFPLEVEAYLRLGLLLHGEERFDEAIQVLKQGLVIDANAKDIYNALGAIYSDLGRHEEAIAMFQHYVQLAPAEPNAYDSLASGYQWAGRYDEAIAEFKRALALKPNFEIAIIHLGNACFQQGRYEEAIRQYQQYIEKAPSDLEKARGYNSIAVVELGKGELERAERSANQAHKYDTNGIDELMLIALGKRDTATAAKLKEQLDEFQRSDRGRRTSERSKLYAQGYFELVAGRSDAALAEFKEALTHRPPSWNIDAYEDCLANAYLQLGRFDEAIGEYERILKLNPNYPLVYYHLAQAYERKGLKDQARLEYQRFLEVWKHADADVPEMIRAKQALSR